MKILGIDLAGKEENPTGLCVLQNKQLFLKTLHKNLEILEMIEKIKPSLIAIDAPLSMPKGRCCLEQDCSCAIGGHFRQAEREIRSYGRLLPLTFGGMKMLTLRGIELSKVLKKDYEVIETHPRTSQKILKIADLKQFLNKYFYLPSNANEHELDAALAALTGFLYIKECYLEIGDPEEGTIIIPGENCSSNIISKSSEIEL